MTELYIRNVEGASKEMIADTFVPFGAVMESIKKMHDVLTSVGFDSMIVNVLRTR